MRVNRLALIALVAGVILLCVFGYSLTEQWKLEKEVQVPVYNFDNEQIGYFIKEETSMTVWGVIGIISLFGGLLSIAEGFVYLKPDDP